MRRTRQGKAWYERTWLVCGGGFLALPLLLMLLVAAANPQVSPEPPSAHASVPASSGAHGAWQELGPAAALDANIPNPRTGKKLPVSGRVNAVAVDPSSCAGFGCRTIYVGAATGGVWKTTNAGGSWKPLLDRQPDLAVGSIALDPRNPRVVYVGTGDPNHSEGSQAGVGILRSNDGGRTWLDLGRREFENRAISTIILDPRTAGTTHPTLYATSVRAYSGGSASGGSSSWDNPRLPTPGFYLSRDGGRSWSLSNPSDLPGEVLPGGLEAQSLVMDPANPNVLYAGFDYAGIYWSADDGRSWTHLTHGLPQENFYTVKLAVAPGDSSVLYAGFYIRPRAGRALALYRTADRGAHWTRLVNAPSSCGTQCRDNIVLAVDPADADTLYVGGTGNYDYLFDRHTPCARLSTLGATCSAAVMKTTDSGQTWADIAENGGGGPLHPDLHAILVDPRNRQVLYVGTDGGLFHTADGGKTWNDLNEGLATFQVQALSVSSTGAIYAGTQDNGTLEYGGSGRWTQIGDGDGGFTATDPTNPTTVYLSHDGATLFRNDSGGATGKNTFIAPFWGDFDKQQRGQSYEPFSLAPSRPDDIFYGTYRLWRSQLRGGIDGNGGGDATNDKSDTVDWEPISFDLSCASRPARPEATCDGPANEGQGISAVAVSPVDADTVVAASANGHLWLTRNALAPVRTDATCDPRANRSDVARCHFVSGVEWTRIDRGLPRRFPSSIRFAPGSPSTLYVTFSGYDENTPGHAGHIFVSSNLGRSWRNLSRSLPDRPFADVLVNPENHHLYAAADPGIFTSADNGKRWKRADRGLPNAAVYQMQFDERDHTLLAGTYGRGVWWRPAP